MLTDEHAGRVAHKVTDEVELEEFDSAQDRVGQDSGLQYRHWPSPAGADAVSRAFIRLVPVAYGALLGGLSGYLGTGLVLGILLTVVFDVLMGRTSLVRAGLRAVSVALCLAVAWVVRAVSVVTRRFGLPAPAGSDRPGCAPRRS